MEPPTLEELVREVGISQDQLDQRCSNEHLKSISLFLDWRNIAPHLGLSERDIKDIESERKTESERRLKVLQKWKMKYGFTATLKSLVVILMTVGNADDAEKVCRLLQSQAGRHKTLERNIEKEIQKLENLFLNVVDKAANHLETIRLLDLQRCVTQLPVSVKHPHIRFLQGNLSAINNAKSVNELFSILSLYWDFLNCGLLNEIVHRLGNDETKQLMEEYVEKLREFRKKTKLGDYIGKRAQSTPPYFTEFTTEMGGDWRVRTLEDLEEFRVEQAQLMHMEEYALSCKKIKLGSISVTWSLQSSLPRIANTLHPLLEEKYNVLKVIFRGKHISESRDLAPLEAPPTATPTAPLALPPPLEEGQLDTQEDFDIISALLGAGVPHIPDQIFGYLDGPCLVRAEAVSTLWRAVVGEGPVWKNLVKQTVKSNGLRRGLFERRGWNKYLHVPLSQRTSSQFYRRLHQSASRDIHSLETNWRRGHYTLTKIETGSTVFCLQYDGDKIVTGHNDGTIKILDRSTLQVSKVLKGHMNWVWCLQYNEEMLISGSYDHTVKVWDIQTGLMVNELLHHKGSVESLRFTTNTLVTGSLDYTVAVWDMKSPTDITLRTVLKRHWDVYAVDLSETNIFSGSYDKTIKVWDSLSGGLVRTLHGHSGTVRSLQLRGSHLISGSWDETIRIWNIDSGDCIGELHGHDRHVLCVAVDDNRIISGSADRTVKVWDLAAALDSGSSSDALITTLKHEHWVRAVSFDAFQLMTGSDDGSVLIYDFLELDPVTSS